MIRWDPPPPTFIRYEQRLASFRFVNRHTRQAAKAGYFYNLPFRELTCFMCLTSLKHSLPTDILMADHALSCPTCPYVRLTCSPEFNASLSDYKSRYVHFPHEASYLLNKTHAAQLVPVPVHQKTAAQQCQLQNLSFDSIPEVMRALEPLLTYGQEEETPPDGNECTICLTNQRRIALFPCKHVSLCAVCVLALTECPCCREPIQFVLRIQYPNAT